jgi:predicted dehydrogenase
MIVPSRSVSILGLGSIGMRHARNLQGRGVNVVGFDPDPARREALVAIGGQVAASRVEAIDTAEAVIIASPTGQHLDDLTDALKLGRHVFVEKPISHRLEGIRPLLDGAKRNGQVIAVGFNLRFHAAVIAAKRAVAAGSIGRPIWASVICGSFLPSWRPNTDYRNGYAANPRSGGVILDVVHEIDLALFLLGPGKVTTATAGRTGLLDMPSEDIADFTMLHDGGERSAIHLDYVSRPAIRTTRVVGGEGSLIIDLLKRQMQIFAPDGTVVADTAFPGSFDADYMAAMDAFLASLDGGGMSGASGEDGLRALEAALAARQFAGLPN